MRNYKEYCKKEIGYSDIASLVLAGCKSGEGAETGLLNFGGDGCYRAYICDEDAIIGEKYVLEYQFESWLAIYDDARLTFKVYADKINVYRCGDYGCIIQIIGER